MGLIDDRKKPTSQLTRGQIIDTRDPKLLASYPSRKAAGEFNPPIPDPEPQAPPAQTTGEKVNSGAQKANSFLEGFLPGVTGTFHNILSGADSANDEASAQSLQQGIEGLNDVLRQRLTKEKDPEKRKALQDKIAANLGTIEQSYRSVGDNPQYHKTSAQGLAQLGQAGTEGASFVYGGPVAQAALQGGGAALGEYGEHGKVDQAGVVNSLLSGIGGAIFGKIGNATGGITSAVTRGIADVGLNAAAQGGLGVAREAVNREVAPERASGKSYAEIAKENAEQGAAFAGLFNVIHGAAAGAEGRAAASKAESQNKIIDDRPTFVDKRNGEIADQKAAATKKAADDDAFLASMGKDIDNGIVNKQVQLRNEYAANPPEVRNSLIRDVVPPEGYKNPANPAQNDQEGLPTRPVDSISGIPSKQSPEKTTVGNGQVDTIQSSQAVKDLQVSREDAVKIKQSLNDLQTPSKAKQDRAERTLAKIQDKYQADPSVIAQAAGIKPETEDQVKERLLNQTKAKSQSNTDAYREKALNGALEEKRLTDTGNIKVYRAAEGDIKQGDFVTVDKGNADRYQKLRPKSQVRELKVPATDLIEGSGLKNEFVYAPKPVESKGEERNSRFAERTTGEEVKYNKMSMDENTSRAQDQAKDTEKAIRIARGQEAAPRDVTRTAVGIETAKKLADEGRFAEAADVISHTSEHLTRAGQEIKSADVDVGDPAGWMLDLAQRRRSNLTTRGEGGKKVNLVDRNVELAKKEINNVKITSDEVNKKIDDITCA